MLIEKSGIGWNLWRLKLNPSFQKMIGKYLKNKKKRGGRKINKGEKVGI